MSHPHHSDVVDPSANLRAFLTRSGHQTLQIIESVRGKYITSQGDRVCMRAFNRLIVNAGLRADPNQPHSRHNRREGRLLVITGASGAGKSHRLKRTLRKHPAFKGYNAESPDSPVVFVNVPSPCTLKQLGRQTLAMTGYPLERDLLEHITWEKVRRRLDQGDKLILIFDEMQHITQNANSAEQEKIANTIKDLLIDEKWRVSVVVCGLPAVADFIRSDIQLRRRARFIRLKPLAMPQGNADIAAMISALAGVAGLSVGSDIEHDLAPRLIHSAGRQWGIAIELTHEAIEIALQPDYLDLGQDDDEIDLEASPRLSPDGELTRHHFAQAFEDLMDCTEDENPFTSRDWTSIRVNEPAALHETIKAVQTSKKQARKAGA
jgi:hypothetical protein